MEGRKDGGKEGGRKGGRRETIVPRYCSKNVERQKEFAGTTITRVKSGCMVAERRFDDVSTTVDDSPTRE